MYRSNQQKQTREKIEIANRMLEEEFNRYFRENKQGMLEKMRTAGIADEQLEAELLKFKHQMRLELMEKVRSKLREQVSTNSTQQIVSSPSSLSTATSTTSSEQQQVHEDKQEGSSAGAKRVRMTNGRS